MYNSQEMATAVQYSINAVVVVFNDNAYGMNGVRVETPEGLETAIKQCLAHDGPSLIEVPVGPLPTPFERLG